MVPPWRQQRPDWVGLPSHPELAIDHTARCGSCGSSTVSAHSTVPAVAPQALTPLSAKHTIPFNRPDPETRPGPGHALLFYSARFAVVAAAEVLQVGANCLQSEIRTQLPVRLGCIASIPLIPRLR